MRKTLQNIYPEPGTGVVDSYPLGQHVASIGKVEKSLLLPPRHPVNININVNVNIDFNVNIRVNVDVNVNMEKYRKIFSPDILKMSLLFLLLIQQWTFLCFWF